MCRRKYLKGLGKAALSTAAVVHNSIRELCRACGGDVRDEEEALAVRTERMSGKEVRFPRHDHQLRIAFVGSPNVGKSSLIK